MTMNPFRRGCDSMFVSNNFQWWSVINCVCECIFLVLQKLNRSRASVSAITKDSIVSEPAFAKKSVGHWICYLKIHVIWQQKCFAKNASLSLTNMAVKATARNDNKFSGFSHLFDFPSRSAVSLHRTHARVSTICVLCLFVYVLCVCN